MSPDGGEKQWKVLGDPTEASLLVAARKLGFEYTEELKASPRTYELPFDSRRKRMTTIHGTAAGPGGAAGPSGSATAGVLALVKGAPMEVMSLATKFWEPGGVREMTDADREAVRTQNDEFATQALRVLGFAYRDLPAEQQHYEKEEVENELVFVGLAAMMDPPRPEVEDAITRCHTAGISVIMITGDYGVTAESIARRIGLVTGRRARVVTGVEIEEMTDGQLAEALDDPQVLFARVAPEHKMRIALALKSKGEIVAMTGDGVNDAPALKALLGAKA